MHRVTDVVERMREIDADLPRRDGIAVFNRVYLRVTELVRERLTDGFFDDPAFMERLDVAFAQLYLDAVDADRAGREPPPAWAPLLDARRRRGLVSIQFALAGMNAHINCDLAIAVVTTCGRARREPLRIAADYERVNDLLASVVRPIRQSFLDRQVVQAGRRLSPLADVVSAWSLDKARDAAWVNACALWELRRTRALAPAYRLALGRTTGLVSRQLLVPFPRDASVGP
jgi:hypothetical protein